MDHHEILRIITTNDNDMVDFDNKIQRILDKVFSQLSTETKEIIENKCNEVNDNCVRRKYLQTILYVLHDLQKTVLSISDTFMSVNEYRSVKVAIELIISIGIIPCLLPGIGVALNKLCPNAAQLSQESQTDLQKYNRLATITRALTDCYNEISLRPAIITQLGPLLGALFQLAHAPLKKPAEIDTQSTNIRITDELYEQLSSEQAEFECRLSELIENCPQSSVMKELMVLSGLPDAPNWLKRKTRIYLVNGITKPHGVMMLINATCEDILDIGLHWEKLDTISKLIATSHLKDCEQYYNAVCPQLLSILASKNIKHATNIANSCIAALYEANPTVCMEKILNAIAAPFIKRECDNENEFVIKSETEISESIDNLTKCFIWSVGTPQTLPHVLLKNIALPLFDLYTKVYKSASLLKSKVRKLLSHYILNEHPCDNLFTLFLKHDIVDSEYFGERFRYEFGPTGGVEITGKYIEPQCEDIWTDVADSLFDLVQEDTDLSLVTLNYLFEWLTVTNMQNAEADKPSTPEEYNKVMIMVCQQIAGLSLLSNLGNISSIQKALFKSPQSLLSFSASLFPPQMIRRSGLSYDLDALYASLLLIKTIVMEESKSIDWTPFNQFANILKEKLNLEYSSSLLSAIREVIDVIKTRGKTPLYQDLAVDNKNKEDFEQALRDVSNNLLPVRAHGLMTMTKLIESSDPIAIEKKDLILCLFRENLKDDDSFVYLTAINGLCAMALSFPQEVIELLVEQFVNMPQRDYLNVIAAENRVKLGEILVKTTRGLGGMASAYKHVLINGFLCGVRDSDPMIRASSLSCLGELCKILGFSLGNAIIEVLYCIGYIIQSDKSYECRRAAVLVITLLIRGLGKDVLNEMTSDILPVYRSLKYLRDNDTDDVLRLHAQLALEELDDVVQNTLFAKPILEKTIFLLPQ